MGHSHYRTFIGQYPLLSIWYFNKVLADVVQEQWFNGFLYL